MREVIARNVVLIPDISTSEYCRAWSGKITDTFGSVIDLRTPNMLPHISLYNTAYPTESENILRETLRAFATTTTPFIVHLTTPAIVHGYVFANADVSPEINTLHRTLIETLNPVRDGAFNEFELALQLTPEERERLERTGMILSLEAFLPHVTIARPPATHLDEAMNMLGTINLSFKADAIHLVETGPFGTCKRIIESYALGD